ncbi:MAG: hypothetical protein FJX74_26275 [Armatimonadetes bacterium]|nr:hypothetical protein [Armatimonadota bacterium]
MSLRRPARCAAVLTDSESLRASAALQVLDSTRGVVREAMVIYSVSPALANAAELLAAGLRGHIRRWKELAAST